MLISNQGTLVRTSADGISQLGRNTQGVKLINLRDDETLVGLQRIDESEDDVDGSQDNASHDSAESDSAEDSSE